MFASSIYLSVLAAGLLGNLATAYVIKAPDGSTLEIAQNINSTLPDSELITYNASQSLSLDRNNLTTCPCSILGYVVPAQSYLDDILVAIEVALGVYPNSLIDFSAYLALLYVQIYILPNGRIWAICCGCQFCYNPGCSVWILIQLNVFGGIVIKICN